MLSVRFLSGGALTVKMCIKLLLHKVIRNKFVKGRIREVRLNGYSFVS